MTNSLIFGYPYNIPVITTKKVLTGEAWVGHVSHDLDEVPWQFLENSPNEPDIKDATVIGFQEMIEIDPSLTDILYIKPGQKAWRETKEGEWKIENT